jgi:hypothetical protein
MFDMEEGGRKSRRSGSNRSVKGNSSYYIEDGLMNGTSLHGSKDNIHSQAQDGGESTELLVSTT